MTAMHMQCEMVKDFLSCGVALSEYDVKCNSALLFILRYNALETSRHRPMERGSI